MATSETQAVSEYKETSDIFKNAILAAEFCNNTSSKERMVNLLDAISFDEILTVAAKFNPGSDKVVTNFILKTLAAAASYFSTEAKFAYYALQLEKDVARFAVAKGYSV